MCPAVYWKVHTCARRASVKVLFETHTRALEVLSAIYNDILSYYADDMKRPLNYPLYRDKSRTATWHEMIVRWMYRSGRTSLGPESVTSYETMNMIVLQSGVGDLINREKLSRGWVNYTLRHLLIS